MKNIYKDVLLGVAVGDALGVPVEFKHRDHLTENPVTEMMGHGSHGQEIGTWSDDTSLTLCLADALVDGYDVRKIAKNFHSWLHENLWTARGVVFDIGGTTHTAIQRYPKCKELSDYPKCGGNVVTDNGNGSLMRIAPLVFLLKDEPDYEERLRIVGEVSSLTHAHPTSVFACMYYVEYALKLISGKNKNKSFSEMFAVLEDFGLDAEHMRPFEMLSDPNFKFLHEDEILSTGYVIHSLEASIWCILNTENYKDAVLKAVNLGSDTDTTAAITGALAGLLYGHESICEEWIDVLARKDDINDLADKLQEKYG